MRSFLIFSRPIRPLSIVHRFPGAASDSHHQYWNCSSCSFSGKARIAKTTEAPPVMTSNSIRLSKWIAQNANMSRREAERLIASGDVKIASETVFEPARVLEIGKCRNMVTLQGKIVNEGMSSDTKKGTATESSTKAPNRPKVWVVHKLPGELVTDNDPFGRPTVFSRISGFRKYKQHMKTVGRLDMSTEGLLLVTTCGAYARAMELPSSNFHRTYRVRCHGALHQYKLDAMRRGVRIASGIRYDAMRVEVEQGRKDTTSTNQWLKITCTQGKNRQLRNVLKHFGLTVTRLIRTSFGDYELKTIPRGMALEVPYRPIEKHRNRGPLFKPPQGKGNTKKDSENGVGKVASPIQWVRATTTK